MTVQGVLKTLEEDAVREFEHYRMPQLARQFAAGYVTVLIGSLASAGWHVAGWAALWSLLGGAALATAERLWPTIPRPVFLALLRDARTTATPSAPSAPPPTPGPKSTG